MNRISNFAINQWGRNHVVSQAALKVGNGGNYGKMNGLPRPLSQSWGALQEGCAPATYNQGQKLVYVGVGVAAFAADAAAVVICLSLLAFS